MSDVSRAPIANLTPSSSQEGSSSGHADGPCARPGLELCQPRSLRSYHQSLMRTQDNRTVSQGLASSAISTGYETSIRLASNTGDSEAINRPTFSTTAIAPEPPTGAIRRTCKPEFQPDL